MYYCTEPTGTKGADEQYWDSKTIYHTVMRDKIQNPEYFTPNIYNLYSLKDVFLEWVWYDKIKKVPISMFLKMLVFPLMLLCFIANLFDIFTILC